VPEALHRARALKFTGAARRARTRIIPEETAVALVYDGVTHAVMMASPSDLEDFALGFSLTEGKIARPEDIAELEIVEHDAGIEARIWLAGSAGREVTARRRAMLGPTGCGLCGVDSLDAALPDVPQVAAETRLTPDQITAAVGAVRPAQAMNAQAHALHAAGFWIPDRGLVALREDVGRHNALDKLVGALMRLGVSTAEGVVVLTSRLSVEMVQKAAVAGAPVVAAVSAPTALALRTAEAAGITVVAVARDDGFELFTRPDRIAPKGRAGARDEEAALRAAS
jgi:FdhD protein